MTSKALGDQLSMPLPAHFSAIVSDHVLPALAIPATLAVTAWGQPGAMLWVVGGSCCGSIILELI